MYVQWKQGVMSTEVVVELRVLVSVLICYFSVEKPGGDEACMEHSGLTVNAWYHV
jgi:hypothetical protein